MTALSLPGAFFSRLLLGACLATAALGASAAQVDVAGVKLEDQMDLRGTPLVLNGAGIRYKAIFKVYTAGLYMGKKASTTEEALAAPGPKRVAITMLRDIDANELGKLFTKGVEDNSPKSEMVNLIPGLLRMGQRLIRLVAKPRNNRNPTETVHQQRVMGVADDAREFLLEDAVQ